MAAAATADERCGLKHFCFQQKYHTRPQAAADVFTDTSACIFGPVHVVHIYGLVCAAMCGLVLVCERIHDASVFVHRRVHGNVLVCTSLLRFLLLSPANCGREGMSSWLSHRCLERHVGQWGSWNLTCAHCQRRATAMNACIQLSAVVKVDRRIRWQYTTTILCLRIGARLTRYRNCKFHNRCLTISRHADGISRYSVPPSAGPLLPLTKRVLYADLHVELRSHLSLLWNWRAISSHV